MVALLFFYGTCTSSCCSVVVVSFVYVFAFGRKEGVGIKTWFCDLAMHVLLSSLSIASLRKRESS